MTLAIPGATGVEALAQKRCHQQACPVVATVPAAERRRAIQRPALGRGAYVVEGGIPGRVQGLRSGGGTCAGLLAVCLARIVHRDRGALRGADFDLLTLSAPS